MHGVRRTITTTAKRNHRTPMLVGLLTVGESRGRIIYQKPKKTPRSRSRLPLRLGVLAVRQKPGEVGIELSDSH
jgi:hypothetical protein